MLTLSPDMQALIQARAANAGKTPDEFLREALAPAGETVPFRRSVGQEPTKKEEEEVFARLDGIAARPAHDPLPLNEPVIRPVRSRPDIAAMKEIARKVARLPVLDTRSEKEICDEAWGH